MSHGKPVGQLLTKLTTHNPTRNPPCAGACATGTEGRPRMCAELWVAGSGNAAFSCPRRHGVRTPISVPEAGALSARSAAPSR